MKLFLSLALFAAFLLCPTACADGVREGLSLAAVQALPALFPFFVVSGLLVRCDTARLSPLLAKPLARLYGLPPEAAPALVLGLIGGYPVRMCAALRGCAFPRSGRAREPVLQLRQSGLLRRTGWSRRVRLRAGRRDAVRDTYRFGTDRRIIFRAYPIICRVAAYP